MRSERDRMPVKALSLGSSSEARLVEEVRTAREKLGREIPEQEEELDPLIANGPVFFTLGRELKRKGVACYRSD